MFGPSAKYQAPLGSPCGVTVMPSTGRQGRRPPAYAVAAARELAEHLRRLRLQVGACTRSRLAASASGSTPGGGGTKLSRPKPSPRGCWVSARPPRRRSARRAAPRAPREKPAPGRAPVLNEYVTVYWRGAFGIRRLQQRAAAAERDRLRVLQRREVAGLGVEQVRGEHGDAPDPERVREPGVDDRVRRDPLVVVGADVARVGQQLDPAPRAAARRWSGCRCAAAGRGSARPRISVLSRPGVARVGRGDRRRRGRVRRDHDDVLADADARRWR